MSKYIRKTIRFSDNEYKNIQMELEKNNLDFTTFARKALLNQKIKFPIKKEVLYELNTISIELEKIAKYIYYNELKDRKLFLIKLFEIENRLSEIL
jgi:hypothetical protein